MIQFIPAILKGLAAVGKVAGTVGKVAGSFGKGMMGMKSMSSPLALGKMGNMAGPLANIMKGANQIGQFTGALKTGGAMGGQSSPLDMIKMLFGGNREGDLAQNDLNRMAETPFTPSQVQNVQTSVPISFAPITKTLAGRQIQWPV